MELNNVAEANPAVVNRLRQQVTKWQKELPTGPFDEGAGSNAYPWPE